MTATNSAGETKMKERPILFSSAMVLAILNGRKTQTRRVIITPDDTKSIRWLVDQKTVPHGKYTGWVIECGAPLLLPRKCPYGQSADRLWVRETFCIPKLRDGSMDGNAAPIYKADLSSTDLASEECDWSFTPSIFMPRWASRITLEIVGVRVERLQEISNEDAIREGCWSHESIPATDVNKCEFKTLWDSINKKRGHPWSSNCWVWVIEFRKLPHPSEPV